MYEFKSSSLDLMKKRESLKPRLVDYIWKRFGYLLDVKYKPKGDNDKLLLDVNRLCKLSDKEILSEIEHFLSTDVRRTIHTLYATLNEIRQDSEALEKLRYYFVSLYKEIYKLNGIETDEDGYMNGINEKSTES
jgi:hypothetical protein